MPPSPVKYTEVQEYSVHRTIQLPGTVLSRTLSLVAGEVPGLVIELSAREGDTVRKGQPLAQLRTQRLELQRDAAVAQLKEAESRLKLSEISLTRVKGLLKEEVASQQDFDNALYEHTAWEGRVEDLKARIAEIDLGLALCTIRAPFAGLVTEEMTEVGQWLEVGGTVVEMISLAEMEIHVDVPERYFSMLNPGATASVTLDAIPGLEISGVISAIIAQADPEARTFPMRIAIQNKDGRIGSGMLAQVTFPAGKEYRATVVPKDAVVRQGQGEFVYRISGENKVDMIPVQTGEGVGSWVVVNGDLTVGQKVVTRGNERLFPGMAVAGELLEYSLP